MWVGEISDQFKFLGIFLCSWGLCVFLLSAPSLYYHQSIPSWFFLPAFFSSESSIIVFIPEARTQSKYQKLSKVLLQETRKKQRRWKYIRGENISSLKEKKPYLPRHPPLQPPFKHYPLSLMFRVKHFCVILESAWDWSSEGRAGSVGRDRWGKGGHLHYWEFRSFEGAQESSHREVEHLG